MPSTKIVVGSSIGFVGCKEEPFIDTADGVAGFSLHASVVVKVSERKKLEQIPGGGPAATSADRQYPRNDCH